MLVLELKFIREKIAIARDQLTVCAQPLPIYPKHILLELVNASGLAVFRQLLGRHCLKKKIWKRKFLKNTAPDGIDVPVFRFGKLLQFVNIGGVVG